LRSRLNREGRPPDTAKSDFREWLVPPVLMPIFFGLLIAAAAVTQRSVIY
jgi:hypothetical protein